MISHKDYGIKNFIKHNFENAMLHFSLALQENPEDKELQTYLNLSSLAKEKKDEAIALFEFYTASLKNSDMREDLDDTIDSLQLGLEKLHNIFESKEIDSYILEENGITYEDFLDLVEQRGSFTRAFEDIMFSTRVLISKKEDFIHFLNLLVDNGFTQMALNYLESATSLFPGDSSLQDVANKVNR